MWKDEYPTLWLPKLPLQISMPQERWVLQRYVEETVESPESSDVETEDILVKDVSTNTDITYKDLVTDLELLKKEVTICYM